MVITEKDIFLYVLFPDELDSDKKKYIQENENLFSDRIEYFKFITEIFNDENIDTESKKAADIILARFKVVELLPVINNNLNKNNTVNLAAATNNVAEKLSESITYLDEDSKYLVKVIRNKNQNKLYFFSKNENREQKLRITLIPSMDIFHITNYSLKIDINPQLSIQKILIEKE